MDEANRKHCSTCRERCSTNNRNDARKLIPLQTARGLRLLLLVLMLMLLPTSLAMTGLFTRMQTKAEAELRQPLSDVIGDLGFSTQGVSTQHKISDANRNIGAIQSSRTAGRRTMLKHREKRETNNENTDAFRGNNSYSEGSRPVHSESQQTAIGRRLLANFKQRINRATSIDEIRSIVTRSDGLGRDVFRSAAAHTTQAGDLVRRRRQCCGTKGSAGVRVPVRRSNTNVQLLKAMQKNATCYRKNATIVSEFTSDRSPNKASQLSICGPIVTPRSPSHSEEWTDKLSEAAENHAKWLWDIQENSLCLPMEMIINLEPEHNPDESQRPVRALFLLKKCRPFYIAPGNEENVTCFARKKRTKLVSLEHGRTIKTYIVSDHLECSATTNRSAVARNAETTTYKPRTKVNSKLKIKKLCPWPFSKVNGTRCICSERKDGSKGHIRYMACRNIQKGIWKLQHRQARCIRNGRCLEPICDRKKFRPKARRCPKTTKPNAKCRSST